jgi:hypothetical protein
MNSHLTSRPTKTAPGATPGPWEVTDSGVRSRDGYIFHTVPVTRYKGHAGKTWGGA